MFYNILIVDIRSKLYAAHFITTLMQVFNCGNPCPVGST